MLLVKESARWLAKRGRNDEALESLIWVRGGEDSPAIQAEFAEILMGIHEEVRATEGLTWKELLLPANRYRIFIAVSLQLCQQLTGNTSLAFYAPQIFAAVGAGTSSLLITGFFGIIKVISVLCFQVSFSISWIEDLMRHILLSAYTFCPCPVPSDAGFSDLHVDRTSQILLIERIGRKMAFMGGAAASEHLIHSLYLQKSSDTFKVGTFMLIIAIIVATNPPDPNATRITSTGVAAIAMVYAEAASFNLSWGPAAW